MTRRLDRGGESTAAHIMLPAYPILCTYLGVMYLSPPEALLASPVLEVANEHLPIHLWGVLFLLVAAVQVVALIVHRCILYEVALILMVVAMVVWAAVFVAAAREGGSPTAWCWPAFVAVACYANLAALVKGEEQVCARQ